MVRAAHPQKEQVEAIYCDLEILSKLVAPDESMVGSHAIGDLARFQ